MVVVEVGRGEDRVVALEVLVVAETQGVPADVFLHLIYCRVVVFIVQIELVHVPGWNRLVSFHHGIVRIGGLTLIDRDLSLLDSSLGPVFQLLFEPRLSVLFSLEINLLRFLHVLLERLIVHHIQNLVNVRFVRVGSFGFKIGYGLITLGFLTGSSGTAGIVAFFLVILLILLSYPFSAHKLLELADAVATVHAKECTSEIDAIMSVEVKWDVVVGPLDGIIVPLVKIVSLLSIDLVVFRLLTLSFMLRQGSPLFQSLYIATLVV